MEIQFFGGGPVRLPANLRRQRAPRLSMAVALCALLGWVGQGAAHATSYTWTGATLRDSDPNNNSTSWNTAANWSPGGVPASGDGAAISNGDSIDSSGVHNVASLNLASGSLNGGTFTVTSNFTWTGGSLAGLSMTIASGAEGNISGTGDKYFDNMTWSNRGTTTWLGGAAIRCITSNVDNYGLFRTYNEGDGTLFVYWTGNGTNFNNIPGATFSKSVGTGTLQFSNNAAIPFRSYFTAPDQTGPISTIDCQSGTLLFDQILTLRAGTSLVKGDGRVLSTGTTQLQGDVQIGLSGGNGTLEVGGGTFGGPATGAGTMSSAGNGVFKFTAGVLTGNINSSATYRIEGTGDKYFGNLNWANSGNGTWAGGDLRCITSSFSNSGTLTLTGDNQAVYWTGNGTAFNNSGTWSKSGGTGNSLVGNNAAITFSNTGTVDVASGTMQLGGGTSSGIFNTAAGARIEFVIGTQTLNTGANFTGAGRTRVNGGTVTVNGNVATAAGGTCELAAGLLNGGGTLQGNGMFEWTGGSLGGTLAMPAGTQLRILGAGDKYFDNGTVNNSGTTTWDGASAVRCISSTWNNLAGSTFAMATDGTVFVYWAGNVTPINNAGTILKSGGAGTTQFSNNAALPLNNTGTLQVDTGTLLFDQVLNLNDGSSITGAGKVLSTGTTRLNATISVTGNLEIGGGTFIADATVKPSLISADTHTRFTTGSVSGDLTIPAGSQFNVTGTGDKYVGNLTLGNDGTVIWDGAAIRCISSTFNNRGTWTIGAAGPHLVYWSGNGTPFNNSGTLVKTVGGDTQFSNNGALPLNNTGTVRAQEGNLIFDQVLNLQNGSNIGGAAKITLAGATNLQGSTTLVGSGGVDMTGGTLNGTAGALLSSSGAVTEGVLKWLSGSWTGTVDLSTSAKVLWIGTGDKYVNSLTLNNRGNLAWSGGDIRCISSSLNNLPGGAFAVLGPGQLVYWNGNGTAFTNAGTLDIGAPIGIFQSNNGAVTFAQTATGVLNLELASASSFDKLVFPGNATLGGTLNAIPVNGFTPAAASTFLVFDYDNHTGTFASVNGPFTASYVDNAQTNTHHLLLVASRGGSGDHNTITGRVFDLNGTSGLNGVKVFLLKNNNIAALLAETPSSDVQSTLTAGTTSTTAGTYRFANLAAGTYRVIAFKPGTVFNPVVWNVPIPLADSSDTFDFRAARLDDLGPEVTITAPQDGNVALTNVSTLAATGTSRDVNSGGRLPAGTLAVSVALYRLPVNVSTALGERTPDGVYNWTTNAFVAANTQGASILKVAAFTNTDRTAWAIPASEFPNLPAGAYRLSVIGVDNAFNVGTPEARNFTVGAAPGVEVTPPIARIVYPTAGVSLTDLTKIEATATDLPNPGGSGVSRVQIFLFRNRTSRSVISTGADVREFAAQFWNGTSWVNYTYRTAGSYTQATSTLPPGLDATFDARSGRWVINTKLPTGTNLTDNTYYTAAIAYDGVGNRGKAGDIIESAQTTSSSGYVQFRVARPTSFTVSGRVLRADGRTGIGSVRVFLFPNDASGANLSAFLSLGSPQIRVTTTNASGNYRFNAVAPNTYRVTPALPGTPFTAFVGIVNAGPAPVTQRVTTNTLIDFKAAATTDPTGPRVLLNAPLGGADSATGPLLSSLPSVGGVISDDTDSDGTKDPNESGVFAVVVGLYRVQGTSTTGVYNWARGEFVAAGSNDAGVFKTIEIAGNPLTANWSLTLPALATGTYRISVIGIDRALRVGTTLNRNFTLGGTPTADDTAPVASILKVNAATVANLPVPSVAVTVPNIASISGTASDNAGGSGVSKVNLYLFRNLQTVIANVAYSAEFWNGTAWVRLNLNPTTSLASLPPLSTTLNPATGGQSVTWTRSSGLPSGTNLPNANYYAAALAQDKAGNTTSIFNLILAGRVIKVQASGTGVRSVTVASGTLTLSSAQATASTSSITLTFASALDVDAASAPSKYFVAVNGESVQVESASYRSGALVLGLPESTLAGGDEVVVQWNDLRDRKGQPYSGGTTLTVK